MRVKAKILRIIMFCGYFPPDYSGATRQAISLSKELRTLGHSVEFLTVQREGMATQDVYDDFPVTRIPFGSNKNYKEIRLWYELFSFALKRRKDFDIIHSHGANYINSIIGPVGKIYGWKSLVKGTLAQSDLYDIGRNRSGQLQKLFLDRVNAYIAISQDIRQEFEACGFAPEKIHSVPNGVDTTRFSPASRAERNELRQKLGLPLGKKIFLTVGVLDNRKNIGWIVDQWDRNERIKGESFLVVVGPPGRTASDLQHFKVLERKFEMNRESMKRYDFNENIQEFYRAADYFILASKSEGMPNVILEAMACGLPCLSTPVSGTDVLISPGENGYLYGFDDAEQFFENYLNVLSLDYLNASRECVALISSRFSFQAVAQAYINIYSQLLNRHEA